MAKEKEGIDLLEKVMAFFFTGNCCLRSAASALYFSLLSVRDVVGVLLALQPCSWILFLISAALVSRSSPWPSLFLLFPLFSFSFSVVAQLLPLSLSIVTGSLTQLSRLPLLGLGRRQRENRKVKEKVGLLFLEAPVIERPLIFRLLDILGHQHLDAAHGYSPLLSFNRWLRGCCFCRWFGQCSDSSSPACGVESTVKEQGDSFSVID
ncbi:hypothetical protein M9H77_06787 [Catharanthus roseus]|uniref:Uncharacterized protein n=1 Tax=Catharanthus roseus TaxID=4058 RepID=A0ACC0BTC8_CATRO|nr:hypothetical protein M9H77_06787 [Catharanthus roseus]